jgi:hypothetical protein
MYHDKFTLAVLEAKEKRLNAEINILKKRIQEKEGLRDKVKFEKLAQEYRLYKIINES